MNAIELEEKAKKITAELYYTFGSGTHVLFGIPNNCVGAVNTIVKLVIQKLEKEQNENND